MKQLWAVCKCGKWAVAPQGFDERKQVMVCPCMRVMFLHYTGTPEDGGYRDKDEVTATIRRAML